MNIWRASQGVVMDVKLDNCHNYRMQQVSDLSFSLAIFAIAGDGFANTSVWIPGATTSEILQFDLQGRDLIPIAFLLQLCQFWCLAVLRSILHY